MFANPHAQVTSVTSDPFHFLTTADISSSPAQNSLLDLEVPFLESMQQKRCDKSASSSVVRALLTAAAKGGMTQKDFELSVLSLRPARKRDVDSKIQRAQGFRGALWSHYMHTPARMSLLAIRECSNYFQTKGWITSDQAQCVDDYCSEKENSLISVKKMFPANDLFFGDLARFARTNAK